jgi:hypothetical protein
VTDGDLRLDQQLSGAARMLDRLSGRGAGPVVRLADLRRDRGRVDDLDVRHDCDPDSASAR